MHDNPKGFTLIELMVTMVISLVVMAGIYFTYQSQQKSHDIQIQVAAMQQNLRAAMFYMEREIRMAGCDPTGSATPVAGIYTAQPTTIEFRSDIRGDSEGSEPDGDTNDTDEHVVYTLYDSSLSPGVNDLGRDTGGANQPVALRIDALKFVYLDRNGIETAVLANIRAVEVTLVARSAKLERGYVNNNVYTDKQGRTVLAAQNDGYRRKSLTVHIDCRNLGI